MLINSTNYNKTNNHLSPLLIEHKKRPQYMTYDVGNPGPSLGQVKLEAQPTEPVLLTWQ